MAIPVSVHRLGGLDQLTRVNDLVKQAVDPVLAVPLLQGRLVSSIAVTAGTPVTIFHQLGRPYVGYFVTRAVGAAGISLYETASSANNTASTLVVTPTGSGTISLWVF